MTYISIGLIWTWFVSKRSVNQIGWIDDRDYIPLLFINMLIWPLSMLVYFLTNKK